MTTIHPHHHTQEDTSEQKCRHLALADANDLLVCTDCGQFLAAPGEIFPNRQMVLPIYIKP